MNSMRKAMMIPTLLLGFVATAAHATTIAQWTFETVTPAATGASPGSFDAEVNNSVGDAVVTANHASAASAWTVPAGFGSIHALSGNTWALGDYFQFSVSTLGFDNISLSWDQTGSNTGPKDFALQYSFSPAGAFTTLLNYTVTNDAWNTTATPAASVKSLLDAPAGLDNAAVVYFRLVQTTTAPISGTFGAGGTDRIDNFTVSGTEVSQVPLPAAAWLFGSGLLGMAGIRRRRRAI